MALQIESLRTSAQAIASSSGAYASISTLNGSLAVAECTVDSGFTCTVEAQFYTDGSWIQVPCLHQDGASLNRRSAGATITLTTGDVLFISAPGSVAIRILRSGGSATVRMTATPDEITNLVNLAGMSGGLDTNATPKFAVIDNATSGDNTLVAAVTGRKIRVLAYMMVAAGTVVTRFESGASGTALTGQMNWVANTGVMGAYSPVGHFETAAGSLLNLELSAAVSVDGYLVYQEV